MKATLIHNENIILEIELPIIDQMYLDMTYTYNEQDESGEYIKRSAIVSDGEEVFPVIGDNVFIEE